MNGGPVVCTGSFGTLPNLEPEEMQLKTDGTAEIIALFFV